MLLAGLIIGLGAGIAIGYGVPSIFRKRKIKYLADEVSRFLRGKEMIDIGSQKEGELAILENEISKMVIRLKSQAELLEKEKTYLVDSIADISHQIRTPLTAMNLIVSRLSMQEMPPEKKKQLLMELDHLLVHVDWLIQALLKMAKLDAGTIVMKKERVILQDMIREALEPIAIPMELREQSLSVQGEQMDCFAGDTKWMQEALLNIVKNCMEHTPNGGRIWIETEENALYTEIIIKDNGPGIEKNDLPHIFERFYKGQHSSENSVGIGLALAKMIIARQDGRITAENRKEGGAKFVIRFYKGTV